MKLLDESLADTPLNQLENTFSFLAGIMSDDTGTQSNNNGLVEVTPGVTVEPFENAVKELIEGGINTITLQPIETEFGYHIIYLKSINEVPQKPDDYDSLTDKQLEDILTNHTRDEVEDYYYFSKPLMQKLQKENFTQKITDKALVDLRNSLNVEFNDNDINDHYLAINNLYLK